MTNSGWLMQRPLPKKRKGPSRVERCTFKSGRPRFGSVRLRFGDGTVQVVPVFGSGGSSAKGFFCVSVELNRKGRFRFRFLESGSGGSGSAFGFRKNVRGKFPQRGFLHLVNPNSTPNSGMRIFEPRILGPNSGVDFFGPMFSNKKSPLKNSPPRNSPPKIHIKKFTPEFGLKNSYCISAGPFC